MLKDKLTHKYQPIVDMIDFQLIRHEALLRVDGVSDIEGLTRSLESSGQIIELDLHTLESVIAHLAAGHVPTAVPIAINVSAISLVNVAFQQKALALLARRPKTLDISIEITESSPISDMPGAAAFVKNLQNIGCSVGMDDFGDGYASLEVMDELHLDYLKLSVCLTKRIFETDEACIKIAEALKFANARGIHVVAEHIDNVAQYLVLRKMGIHYGQGWLFAKADDLISHPERFQNELSAKINQGIKDSF